MSETKQTTTEADKAAKADAAKASTPVTKTGTLSEQAGLEKGKVYRFVAVHGDICHYNDGTRFAPDEEVKHEVDDWVIIQFDAGKLRLGE